MNALEVARVANRNRVSRTNPTDRPDDQCVLAAFVTRRLAEGGCHAPSTNDVEPDYFGLTSSVRAQWFGVGSSIAARRAAILQRVPSSSRSAETSSRELNGRFASSAAATETSSRRRRERF